MFTILLLFIFASANEWSGNTKNIINPSISFDSSYHLLNHCSVMVIKSYDVEKNNTAPTESKPWFTFSDDVYLLKILPSSVFLHGNVFNLINNDSFTRHRSLEVMNPLLIQFLRI